METLMGNLLEPLTTLDRGEGPDLGVRVSGGFFWAFLG